MAIRRCSWFKIRSTTSIRVELSRVASTLSADSRFRKTDCKESIGLEGLRNAIEEVVVGMPEIRMRFPSDWFTVKERLELMKDEYMGYEEFRQLCQNEGIEDDSDQNTLRWVLHCLGIALNYRDDTRLRDTSVTGKALHLANYKVFPKI